MGQVCPNWVQVYFLISGFRDKHHSWATFSHNALQKKPDLSLFDIITSQLLDESYLINISKVSDLGMACLILFLTNTNLILYFQRLCKTNLYTIKY